MEGLVPVEVMPDLMVEVDLEVKEAHQEEVTALEADGPVDQAVEGQAEVEAALHPHNQEEAEAGNDRHLKEEAKAGKKLSANQGLGPDDSDVGSDGVGYHHGQPGGYSRQWHG